MEFKILIIGSDLVGKASLINRCKNDEFNNIGPLNTYVNLSTNRGKIRLQLTQSKTYESDHDADLIMFDLSRPHTMKIIDNIPPSKKPRIVVGNKSDLPGSKLTSGDLKQNNIISKGFRYYDISVKESYAIKSCLTALLQKLVAQDIRLI